jgi:hypothetical protein
MTDYLPLLTRAVANLKNNPEARRKVYDRARQALLAQLRAMNPPLAEAEITRERLALEEAIRRLDQQAGKVEIPVPEPAAAAGPAVPAPGAAPRAPVPPRPAAGAPPRAPAAEVPAPPVSVRDRPAEPASGSKIVRDAVEGARPLGSAAAEAARSARGAFGGPPDRAYELESGADADFESRVRFDATGGPGEPMAEAGRSARGRGTIDYAKADAQKAMKAKLMVGGIVGALLAVAILIGYVNRDRILASLGLGAPVTRVATPSGDAARSSDRIAPTPQAKGSAPSQAPATSVPAAAVAQRSVLYEENPGATEEQLQTFVGTAVWRTETVNPGPGRPPELGLRIEVEIPDRKMTVTISIRRNPDQTLPASHTIEVQFQTPNDPFGGVANLPGIRAKTTETAQGAPLVGLVVRVMPGFFLVVITAFCTFSKARTSIWRTRSRETPNSVASSSSVIGSSARRRASKMRRSRSLSTESADFSACGGCRSPRSRRAASPGSRCRRRASPAIRPTRRRRGSAR